MTVNPNLTHFKDSREHYPVDRYFIFLLLQLYNGLLVRKANKFGSHRLRFRDR